MSSVFYRSPNHTYPRGARGEGVYLYDDQGKQYLDGSGGAAVTCLGHGHPDVIAAIKAQVEELAYAHTAFFTNEPQELLAARLAERFGEAGAALVTGGLAQDIGLLAAMREIVAAEEAKGKPRLEIRAHRLSIHAGALGAAIVALRQGRRDDKELAYLAAVADGLPDDDATPGFYLVRARP